MQQAAQLRGTESMQDTFSAKNIFTWHSEDALIAAMTSCREARLLTMSAPCEYLGLQTS